MKKILCSILICLNFTAVCADLSTEEGVLTIRHGDGHNGEYHQKYQLQTQTQLYELNMSKAFLSRIPIYQWQGRKVQVKFVPDSAQDKQVRVQSIELLATDKDQKAAVSGNQPWVSILCKFSDNNNEPKDQNYFQDMYANQAAGLDHYWREVSYNNINIVGSIAIDWVDLPSTHTTYVPNPGSGTDADLDLLFDDCIAAADSLVDFSDAGNGQPFAGVNMMFNDNLDCCAWGGNRWETLDGFSKLWRVTWNPPWSFANETVVAHEMGHGFGLPHANNSDEDSHPYDNPWDVMSANYNTNVSDPIYGTLGQHINMYFKYFLEWVSDSDGFVADASTNQTIIIDHSALANTSNKRFARIPLNNGQQYFIETRKRVGNYDGNLAGNAVIIHHVDTTRQEPPWVVDADTPPADFSNTEGVMWKVGETFTDSIEGYQIEILSDTGDGFQISIQGPNASGSDLIFGNGFESQ